jgi:hypothetical protein
MGSANEALAMKTDPENKLLWRMNRQRLDAEAIRDALLAVSGELKLDSGGPSLVLEKVENCGGLTQKGINPPNYAHRVPRESQEFERTIYLPVMRLGYTNSDRLRGVFDFPDPAQLSGQRPQTTVPTQALFLLNNDTLRRRAGALAKDLTHAKRARDERLGELWLRVFSRPITAAERDDAAAFLGKLDPLFKERATAETLAWTELCHSLLASNEFIHRL